MNRWKGPLKRKKDVEFDYAKYSSFCSLIIYKQEMKNEYHSKDLFQLIYYGWIFNREHIYS